MKLMNNRQFAMFIQMLKYNHDALIGEYRFTLEPRFSTIMELDQYYKGKKTTLHVGTKDACVEAAEDCIKMMFNITD